MWLLLAGRGFGKTRTGAEWVREEVRTGRARRIAFIAPTPAEARDVMIEGMSGILAVSPEHERPIYEPSKRRLTWPNGAVGTIYSAFEPEHLRGPNHDLAWGDELASWEYLRSTFDMLMFGLRVGERPRAVFTTTPKPLPLLRELLKRQDVRVTTGSTYENRDNLAPSFFTQIVSQYEGTTLGQQELYAQILEEAAGALWTRKIITDHRRPSAPALVRIVVGVDPAVTSTEESNETGIIVAGRDQHDHGYCLADRSGRRSPDQWARTAVQAYHDFKADRIVVEVNNGGEMVAHTIRTIDPNVAIRTVAASRGKYTRAEPIAAFGEQGRIHHVGVFEQLEGQLCTWVPGDVSPDRLDAYVWAFTDLLVGRPNLARVSLGSQQDLGRENVYTSLDGPTERDPNPDNSRPEDDFGDRKENAWHI